ncbi:MAG: hypothetical protein WBP13_03175 [Methylophilaceae bacterium]
MKYFFNDIRRVFAIILLCSLSACYPVYKTIQPKAQALVLDANHQPIQGAKVSLITQAHPTFIHDVEAKDTNVAGLATFDNKREMQREVLFLHGARVYYWEWCIEKAGFATYRTNGDFVTGLTIQLQNGASSSCEAVR